jgi:hypothetical protein
MGDFNDEPWQQLSYCAYTQPGLMVNTYDMAKGNSTNKPCPTKQKIGEFGIDEIYVSQGSDLTASAWTHMGKDPITAHASDHTPVYVTLASPSSSGSTDGSGPATPGQNFLGPDGLKSPADCVDYVEWALSRHSSKYHGGPLGNGKDVANSLGKYGYTVNHTPAVHATVSFGTQYADPTYGHTALVGQVNKDGSIVVEEFNWPSKSNGYKSGVYGTHTVSASEVPHLTYAHTESGWH